MTVAISDHDGAVRVLTIDRPPVNALNQPTIDALADAIESAMLAPEIRAIIITGAGKIFIGGADLDELSVCDAKSGREMVIRVKGVMAMLRRGPKPVIAAINGLAAGGGLELAMACDIRIAHPKAAMGLPEVTLGVLPGAGGTQMLPRLIGLGKAMEMMMTGKVMTAEQALDIGLIEKIAEEGDVLSEALSLAVKIARNAPIALAGIKAAAYATLSTPLEEGLVKETEAFGQVCASEDKNIGIAAFKDRQKPQFTGR